MRKGDYLQTAEQSLFAPKFSTELRFIYNVSYIENNGSIAGATAVII
jgi:hypothetical protein